jgi:hypothetical protein
MFKTSSLRVKKCFSFPNIFQIKSQTFFIFSRGASLRRRRRRSVDESDAQEEEYNPHKLPILKNAIDIDSEDVEVNETNEDTSMTEDISNMWNEQFDSSMNNNNDKPKDYYMYDINVTGLSFTLRGLHHFTEYEVMVGSWVFIYIYLFVLLDNGVSKHISTVSLLHDGWSGGYETCACCTNARHL